MLAAAERTEDEILIGLALASRALFLIDADRPGSEGEDVGGMLARAVAMLDDAADTDPAELGLRAVELPACFVECGQAYHRQGLWELEEEMYVRAAEALAIPLPEAVRPVAGFTRRVLVVNRLESTAALTCALLEIDRRDEARQVATAGLRPEPAEVADLPPGWAFEVRALERLLRAIGALLLGAIRPSDLAVRLGGDEFLLLADLPAGAGLPLTAHAIVRTVGQTTGTP
jgi:hypothetical protein